VFIATRKLLLFKIFFFVACVIALIHFWVNVILVYPLTIFEIVGSVDISGLVAPTIKPLLELFKTVFPIFKITAILLPLGFLISIYPLLIVIGIIACLGVLCICFLYFKRSKRVAVYFGSK
jgi:hypothetical protein